LSTGECVADVTATRRSARPPCSIANLYDIAAARNWRERMTFTSPKTAKPVQRAWQIPHSHADLRARRGCFPKPGRGDLRLMPRPRSRRRLLRRLCAKRGSLPQPANTSPTTSSRFTIHARPSHLLQLRHRAAQIDRSKPAHKQSDPTLYAGVVKERDDGIFISGAQQLATGGPSPTTST